MSGSKYGYWYGRPLEALSREELYEIIRWQGEQHKKEMERKSEEARMLCDLAIARVQRRG